MKGKKNKEPVDVRAAARLMYESTPLTVEEIGQEVGVSGRTVKRWSAADGGWRKVVVQGLSQRAHEAADKVRDAVAELPPDAPAERKAEAMAAAVEDVAVDERAALLAKHRRQWSIVDGLVSEAVRKRDLNAAKLAESVCRTIAQKQTGERKSWGLEAGETAQKIQVVIERE
ncbi:hypothetical protein [Aeromonas dhakensis]|uniref:hypothetical protein n=1 Tax=Aeromonas dhakensis TaxID=196024 RepID=UPI003EC8E6FC